MKIKRKQLKRMVDRQIDAVTAHYNAAIISSGRSWEIALDAERERAVRAEKALKKVEAELPDENVVMPSAVMCAVLEKTKAERDALANAKEPLPGASHLMVMDVDGERRLVAWSDPRARGMSLLFQNADETAYEFYHRCLKAAIGMNRSFLLYGHTISTDWHLDTILAEYEEEGGANCDSHDHVTGTPPGDCAKDNDSQFKENVSKAFSDPQFLAELNRRLEQVRADMKEWRRASRVSPEQMNRPMTI